MATRKKPMVETVAEEPIPVTIEVEPTKEEVKDEPKEETAKPKRKRPARKKPVKPTFAMTAKDLNPILCGAFGIASMKLGDYWAIDEAEATQVTEPLVKVLAKLDLLEKVSNVSDGAMLLIGVASITIPRLLLTQQILKAKAVEKSHGIQSEVRSSQERSGNTSNPTSVSESNDGESIKTVVAESIVNPY